jgi:hypothetical protein
MRILHRKRCRQSHVLCFIRSVITAGWGQVGLIPPRPASLGATESIELRRPGCVVVRLVMSVF